MTIQADPSQVVYAGDGTTVAFAIPFPFDTSADIKVVLTDSDGTPDLLATGYSITGGGGSTGTCTMDVAPEIGESLTIFDDPELTQPADYTTNDSFPADSHEAALDRTVRQVKRLKQRVDRSIRVQDGDNSDGDDLLLPLEEARAGKYLAFDANGDPVASDGTGGGDSSLRTDLASAVASSDGSRLVGYRRTEVGAVARSSFSKHSEIVSVADFGANSNPGTTDMTLAIQRAIDAAAGMGAPAYLPASMGECLISAPLTFPSSRSGLIGDGSGKSRILCANVNGFTVAPSRQFIVIKGLSIASEDRHTDIPNTLTGIDIQGTTANQVYYSRFDDIFIDGFQVSVAAYGVAQCTFSRIDGEFCQRGFIAEQLTQNCFMSKCFFVGAIGSSDRGIVIGDGASAAEGWVIDKVLSYGFDRAAWVRGASTVKISRAILDFFGEFGLVVSSGTNAAFDVSLIDSYLAATGTADTGIHLANAVVRSNARGNLISGNRVLAYAGSSLVNALLCDGAEESNNIIHANDLVGDSYDCKLDTGSGHIVTSNKFRGAGFSAVPMTTYEGNEGTILTPTRVRQTNGENFIYHENGAPSSGTFVRGDISWHTAPSAAGPPGYVCVTGGTPGTWKAMANLAS